MHAAVTALLGTIVAVPAAAALFDTLAVGRAAAHRRRHPPACHADADDVDVPWPAHLLVLLGGVVREAVALSAVVFTLPLVRRRTRPGPQRQGGSRRPVLLVHGYAQHPGVMLRLARALRRHGWDRCYAVAHRSVWGDVDASAARLSAVIDRVRQACGAATVDLVAHGLGGLVARACVRARAGAGIARLVTIGTPHQGTEAFVGWTPDPMVAQARPGSPLLRRLAADDPVPALVDCISIYSHDDPLVLPSGNGYYPGAFNIEVHDLGHASMLRAPRLHTLVHENLAAELADTTAGTTATGGHAR